MFMALVFDRPYYQYVISVLWSALSPPTTHKNVRLHAMYCIRKMFSIYIFLGLYVHSTCYLLHIFTLVLLCGIFAWLLMLHAFLFYFYLACRGVMCCILYMCLVWLSMSKRRIRVHNLHFFVHCVCLMHEMVSVVYTASWLPDMHILKKGVAYIQWEYAYIYCM